MAKLSLFFLAAPIAAASAMPAMAADDTGDRRAYVHYGDLDLASPNARKTLRTRVAQAARQVCGGRPIARFTVREHLQYVKCRSAAIRGAEPQLAKLFDARQLANGGPLHVAVH